MKRCKYLILFLCFALLIMAVNTASAASVSINYIEIRPTDDPGLYYCICNFSVSGDISEQTSIYSDYLEVFMESIYMPGGEWPTLPDNSGLYGKVGYSGEEVRCSAIGTRCLTAKEVSGNRSLTYYLAGIKLNPSDEGKVFSQERWARISGDQARIIVRLTQRRTDWPGMVCRYYYDVSEVYNLGDIHIEESVTEKETASLIIKNIPPTYGIEEDGGGKIVVTVLNETKKPIPNALIYIDIDPSTNLGDVFSQKYEIEYGKSGQVPEGFHLDKYWHVIGTTDTKVIWGYSDKNGNVTWDYMRGLIAQYIPQKMWLDVPELSKQLYEKGGMPVVGTIRAYYVTQEMESGNDILKAYSSIPISFEHIAEISKIGTTDGTQPAKVRSMRIDLDGGQITKGSRQVLPTDCPYKLIPGDTILLDENDIVTINWIDGTEMSIKPKSGFLEKESKKRNESVNAKITIMYGDLGMIRKFQQFMNNWPIQLGISTSGSVITSWKCSKAAGIRFALYYALIYGTFKVTECWDPVVINMKSTILTDFDEDEKRATIYTVEGTGTLYNVNDGSTLNVTTGHKATVSPEGVFGPVTGFDESELNDDLRTILDYMRGGDISVPLKKGLTFESRSKTSGSSVQIPLTLSGIEEEIGNMDMTLSYDPSVLEADEVIKGGLTSGSLFDYNIMDDTIKISLADKDGFMGDGSVACVRFNVIGSEGSSSPLDIVATMANRADDLESIEIPDYDGVFRVVSMEEGLGDADGDGDYTARDALEALQMAVGKIPEDPTLDMNLDGSVTSIDARNILKMAVNTS